MKTIIDIKTTVEYILFYEQYVDPGRNCLYDNFSGADFLFNIQIENADDMDEQILFEYYLIANKYSTYQGQFQLMVSLPLNKNDKRARDCYHRLSSYGFIENRIYGALNTVTYLDGQPQRMQSVNLNGVARMVPVLRINREVLELLRHPIELNIWKKIQNGESLNVDSVENMLYRLCWAFLFRKLKYAGNVLTQERIKAFTSDEFTQMIQGIPLIALILFAMLDYSFREESAETYKLRIRQRTGKSQVRLKKEDFIEDYQNMQDRTRYDVYMEMCETGVADIKSIWNDSSFDENSPKDHIKRQKLHPFLIKELYEGITISEGILQLLENIIYHAGNSAVTGGEGMLSIFLRSTHNDEDVLSRKYQKYFKRFSMEENRYYLEVLIADLSGTNIPAKFLSNNHDFFAENRKRLLGKMENEGAFSIPPEMHLVDFFSPDKEKSDFWHAFFSFPNNAINHYGLQIFDSVLSSKNGLFEVWSGEERYCNLWDYKEERHLSAHGSRYTIFCPMNSEIANDRYIYDSMFEYRYAGLKQAVIKIKPIALGAGYISRVKEMYETIGWDRNCVIQIDTEEIASLEDFLKGMLLYVFEMKEKKPEEELLIAFVNCRAYQIIDIVRILSIYYDKLGCNTKMKNVQIYLRGKNIGEEILFYGENLHIVSENLAKSACMRGIMFDNLQTVNKMLERVNGNGR